jgi:toxin ParE1/3/4
MKVVITDGAFADLLRIGHEIRKDSPIRAESFVAELFDHCKRLGATPRAIGRIEACGAVFTAII